MADQEFENDVLKGLTEAGAAIGALASDEDAFVAAYKAFRGRDAKGYQAALERVGLIERRAIVCEWIRSKECVFLCLALAGPPKPIRKPDPRVLAEAIVRLTADPDAVEQLVAAVEQRDPALFKRVVVAHKLEPMIHLFCHWVCVVRHRLICRWITSLQPVRQPDLATELTSAGKALRTLLAHGDTFSRLAAASSAGEAARMNAIISDARFLTLCPIFCEFFCSWRCTLGCLTFARQFELPTFDDELAEALRFAHVTREIADDAAVLERLSLTVADADAKAFGATITERKLGPFALQLCHWICSLRCRLHCLVVCPPIKCAITSPTGCVAEQGDAVAGFLSIPVSGTAGGSGRYTLKIAPIAGPTPTVTYPSGGPSGQAPVVNGLLGRIDTTSLSDGTYTITLEVHSGGVNTPVICTKTTTFNLLKIGVYISQIGGVATSPNPWDEAAELRTGADVRSVGGTLGLLGSAYVYGCEDQKIERYELRHVRVTAPGPGPLQPATDAAIPAAWPAANQLHPPLVYDPSKYYPCTRVGQAPTNLINSWGTMHVGAPAPGGADYPVLVGGAWNSHSAAGAGGGRYNILLAVRDTQGHMYYDLQRVWIDNWQVLCQIVKFQRPGNAPGAWIDIPNCTDILMSWGRLRIMGIAWDHLIDDAFAATAPNDNFDRYSLAFHKQFVGNEAIPIATPNVRVPSSTAVVPTAATAGQLAVWDLNNLDAGPAPAGGCSAPLPPSFGGHPVTANGLYRGCSCAYELTLAVSDTTVSNEIGVHSPSVSQPIKIVNDVA